ncbi:MAG: signal peptidase I [Oscillospiraceae bacterium]|nr:signal peptidase I [Oscillospiraceae bacterium]
MAKEKSSVAHRIFTILGTILCIILTPILIINVTLIAKSYINKDEVPNFNGLLPMIVLTDSMYPVIESGDLIICSTINPEDVQKGDIISFFDPEGNGTSVVTHRVVEIIQEDGQLSFRTRGDFNNTDDKELVPGDKLVGTYRTRIPHAGNVAMFMQTTTGLIVCVVLPIVLLVGYDMIRRRIYEKNKKGENDALLAELQALRAEKAKKEGEAAVEEAATEETPNT